MVMNTLEIPKRYANIPKDLKFDRGTFSIVISKLRWSWGLSLNTLAFQNSPNHKKKRLETKCLKDTIFNKRFKYNQYILITTLMNWSKPWWFFGFRSASSHDQSIKTLMNWSMPWWLFNIDPWRKQHSFDDVQVHHGHDGWSRSWWMVKF